MKWLSLLIFACAVPAAHAEPWLCTEADGSKAFSYEPESARSKNCVDHPIPSSNVIRVRPRSEMRDERAADFPKVDAKTQRQRDAARREILARELADEKKSLAEATKALADQQRLSASNRRDAAVEDRLRPLRERIRVHLTNISNLERELGFEG
jgi:hypothetical protein